MSSSLLATKLHIPAPRPELVLRSRLTSRLDEALERDQRLTLVSAKAGSGKTTLVSSWAHRLSRPTAWLSLDARDNDPRRFLTYLVAAVRQLITGEVVWTLGQWDTLDLPQVEVIAEALTNQVLAQAVPCIVVLDDYHLIENAWLHRLVAQLIAQQPPGCHLVLITRADPPFPLSKLRGRGHMTEIRDADLRFTTAEVAAFLGEVLQLELSADAVSVLQQRTEGWAVGLQLAALSMRGRRSDGDRRRFVEAFGGTHRFVLDYLTEEVLSRQPATMQEFLMETSILERLCPGLCDAVRGKEPADATVGALDAVAHLGAAAEPVDEIGVRSDSRITLLKLERSNLFLTALDDERRWYRYHHLFADLLRSTLQARRSKAQIRALHLRAGLWFRSQGLIEEAVSHAMIAQEYELAASMIEQHIVAMLARSELPVLLSWIDELPTEVVLDHPWIDVYRANTLALAGQVTPVEALLDEVEARLGPDRAQIDPLRGHIAAIRAYTANLRGAASDVVVLARDADQYLGEEQTTAKGLAAYALADAGLASDDLGAATEALDQMLAVGERTGQLLLGVTALCDMAKAGKVAGRLHEAEMLYDRAYRWMAAVNSTGSRLRCAYEFGLADLLREWNRLDEAYEHAMLGDEIRQKLGGYLVVGDLVLMRLLQSRGDVTGAMDTLNTMERLVRTYHFHLSTMAEFRAARVCQWLAVGDPQMASRCADAFTGGSELGVIALARLRLAQGRPAEALNTLVEQQASAEAGGRSGRLIEIMALHAIAQAALGRHDDARRALTHALDLARPEGYVRIFLDLGAPLRDLLTQTLPTPPACGDGAPVASHPYVTHLLSALQEAPGPSPDEQVSVSTGRGLSAEPRFESLTSRECDVLQLLAEGLTNKAIATRLVVAPSTVKQHLKNIYGKLDVHSRTQAVARGRELGYL